MLERSWVQQEWRELSDFYKCGLNINYSLVSKPGFSFLEKTMSNISDGIQLAYFKTILSVKAYLQINEIEFSHHYK